MFGENAVLLEVRSAGEPDAYGDVEDEGPVVWAGRAPAVLVAVSKLAAGTAGGVDRVTSERGTTDAAAVTLYVLQSTGVTTNVVAGDQETASTVLVEDQRDTARQTRRYRVVGFENRAGGLPIDSLRFDLDDPRSP